MKSIPQCFKSLLAASVSTLLASGSPTVNAEADRGAKIYNDNCASCHGYDFGGYLAPPLNAETLKGRSEMGLRSMVMTGVFDTLMPPFYNTLSDDDIHAEAAESRMDPGRHESVAESLRAG